MSTSLAKSIVIGIYYHPEAYPPTLNAIVELSNVFEEVVVIYRPHLKDSWQYPPNVKLIPSGSQMTSIQQENASRAKKARFFLRFVHDFKTALRDVRPAVVLVYDSIALLAYRLSTLLATQAYLLWYHSHDIVERKNIRLFSIGWLAWRSEKTAFSRIDLFTLPAESRIAYFPVRKLRGEYIVVGNFPSKSVYTEYYSVNELNREVKLIFQGRIGKGHGLETIIGLLTEKLKQKQLQLVLKGFCDREYKTFLMELAGQKNVSDSVFFHGYGPYSEVPILASQCHIGVGIFTEKEIMHLTLGTSSNKLYEYAAVGLPILYSGYPHFQKYLGHHKWAVPVKDDASDIRHAIEYIIENYSELSQAAYASFVEEFNFQKAFAPVVSWIKANT